MAWESLHLFTTFVASEKEMMLNLAFCVSCHISEYANTQKDAEREFIWEVFMLLPLLAAAVIASPPASLSEQWLGFFLFFNCRFCLFFFWKSPAKGRLCFFFLCLSLAVFASVSVVALLLEWGRSRWDEAITEAAAAAGALTFMGTGFCWAGGCYHVTDQNR